MAVILWVAHRDPHNPKAGGAERTIYELCTRLVKNGHKVTLLTGGWKGCGHIENISGLTVYRYGKNLGPHFALPVFLLRNRYDFIVNDLGHAVPWFSSALLSKSNIVFFRHLHSRSLPGQVNGFLSKLITSIERCYFIPYHSSTFVTESKTSENDLVRLGINDRRIFKIPPGVDRDLFHPKVKTAYPSIVYFGGMRKYKRPQECIFLLKNLNREFENVRLTVIGSGPEEKRVRELAGRMNLLEMITFKGRISEMELSDIVASSWLNVHTSVTEGWGLSILEASAAGTPTVAYDVPGVADAVEDGINGIKVRDGDREALTKAALSILRDPEKWWLSSLEVAKKYSWDITAARWEKLMKELEKKRDKRLNDK